MIGWLSMILGGFLILKYYDIIWYNNLIKPHFLGGNLSESFMVGRPTNSSHMIEIRELPQLARSFTFSSELGTSRNISLIYAIWLKKTTLIFWNTHMGLSENVGYTPNEIAIFRRDNHQQNHWKFRGLAYFQTKPHFVYVYNRFIKVGNLLGTAGDFPPPSHPSPIFFLLVLGETLTPWNLRLGGAGDAVSNMANMAW